MTMHVDVAVSHTVMLHGYCLRQSAPVEQHPEFGYVYSQRLVVTLHVPTLHGFVDSHSESYTQHGLCLVYRHSVSMHVAIVQASVSVQSSAVSQQPGVNPVTTQLDRVPSTTHSCVWHGSTASQSAAVSQHPGKSPVITHILFSKSHTYVWHSSSPPQSLVRWQHPGYTYSYRHSPLDWLHAYVKHGFGSKQSASTLQHGSIPR